MSLHLLNEVMVTFLLGVYFFLVSLYKHTTETKAFYWQDDDIGAQKYGITFKGVIFFCTEFSLVKLVLWLILA